MSTLNKPKKPATTLLISKILHIKPTLMTVIVPNFPKMRIDIPIKLEVYRRLISGVARKQLKNYFPLILDIDERGVGYTIGALRNGELLYW